MKTLVKRQKFPYMLFTIFLLMEVLVFLSHKIVSVNSKGNGLFFYKTLLFQPWIWISLLLSLIQFFLWTQVLSKTDLSLAYSMSSLSYPLTMIAATFIFKEHLPLVVWAGGIIITIGVVIVGMESEQTV